MGKCGVKPTPVRERFWPKVRVGPSKDCWEWLGSKDPRGYGRLFVGGRGGRPVAAHRIAWELTFGPIPEGEHVCHKCDWPSCCNPDHLFLGSRSDNMQDAAKKGRIHGQQNTHCAKGHELTLDNIYTPTGTCQRQCRQCKRDSTNTASMKRRARYKEAGLNARGEPYKR
jgi:hypothetical protein